MQLNLEDPIDLLDQVNPEAQESQDPGPTQNDQKEKAKTIQWWCVVQNLASHHFRFEKEKNQ